MRWTQSPLLLCSRSIECFYVVAFSRTRGQLLHIPLFYLFFYFWLLNKKKIENFHDWSGRPRSSLFWRRQVAFISLFFVCVCVCLFDSMRRKENAVTASVVFFFFFPIPSKKKAGPKGKKKEKKRRRSKRAFPRHLMGLDIPSKKIQHEAKELRAWQSLLQTKRPLLCHSLARKNLSSPSNKQNKTGGCLNV